jgi:serine/threonine protein kinase/tetratricopeptide (TPR) repeat protein
MTEAVAATTGRRLDARYTLLEVLGAGGQGEVRRAHDEVRGVDVALKILSPTFAHSETAWSALQHEYDIASRLDHPAILRVFPPERSGEVVVLPMELASGGDLRRLRGAGYLEIIPVLLEVAQALEHAHERGVVHRDLKPGNVLFDARGRVKLADFGVAGTVSAGPQGGKPGLSPFTASPEQLRGEPATEADDIYGLGALAYELLSGYPPYYPHFDARRAAEEPVPELVPTRQIPPLLGTLVMRMLAKRAVNRPRSMREVIDELDAALNDTLTFEFAREAGVPMQGASYGAMDSAPPLPEPAAAPPTTSATPLSPKTPAPAASLSTANGSNTVLQPAATPESPAAAAGEFSGGVAEAIASLADAEEISAPRQVPRQPAAAEQASRERVSREAVARDDVPRETSAEEFGWRARETSASGPSHGPRVAMSAAAARTAWEDLKLEPVPRASRLEPMRARRWPWIAMTLLIAAAIGAFYVLPRYAPELLPPQLAALNPAPQAPAPSEPAAAPDHPDHAGPADQSAEPAAGAPGQTAPPPEAQAEEKFRSTRESFDSRLSALENRGAGVWGGHEFSDAKTRAAESVGAHDAGNTALAQSRLEEAAGLLAKVEGKAPQALTAQLDAAEKALAAGRGELATQAFDLAKRIDPSDRRVTAGLGRLRNLSVVLPLLADAENAERARNYARAVQDYGQAIALDPGNTRAKAGLSRANAAFGDDNYAKAVGAGFAALGAGRLDEAHEEFQKARAIKPTGAEAAEGLRRVAAVQTARGFADTRQRAAALESQERWDEAASVYDSALKADPSLLFAQQGKARASARAELASRLQGLIDHPERLAAYNVRQEARTLLQTANAEPSAGPVLRSQVTRLEGLLPDFDKPVHLSLVSDNATQVAIPSIGSFGTFARREIELKPGKYTLIGTRNGYRDVRRDITVSPGQTTQTVSITCSEPI